jgi:hypothetical protein
VKPKAKWPDPPMAASLPPEPLHTKLRAVWDRQGTRRVLQEPGSVIAVNNDHLQSDNATYSMASEQACSSHPPRLSQPNTIHPLYGMTVEARIESRQQVLAKALAEILVARRRAPAVTAVTTVGS